MYKKWTERNDPIVAIVFDQLNGHGNCRTALAWKWRTNAASLYYLVLHLAYQSQHKGGSSTIPSHSMALQQSYVLNSTQIMGSPHAQRTPRQVAGSSSSSNHPLPDWRSLAHSLGNSLRREFLSAVETLLCFYSLSPADFKLHSRKVCSIS